VHDRQRALGGRSSKGAIVLFVEARNAALAALLSQSGFRQLAGGETGNL
jgi:hypothetical protein